MSWYVTDKKPTQIGLNKDIAYSFCFSTPETTKKKSTTTSKPRSDNQSKNETQPKKKTNKTTTTKTSFYKLNPKIKY